MREIVFDTETTGFTFGEDRMVEIGCVELINRVETGRTFHAYFHPERSMPPGAFAIHGLSDAFLSDKPLFHTVAEELVAFIGDAPLIAHNASFDFGFLNGELGRCGRDVICTSRMVDTLAIAKQRHPGAKLTLDALCSRYGIDRSHRVLHGALLDAQLLAQVYVELRGGRQIGLSLVSELVVEEVKVETSAPRVVRPARHFAATAEELSAHAAFMTRVKNPLWGAEASG
ncbi:DNA polymerase III subunit epsilon [Sphingomonas sp. IC4-52]|uniref:DNA polymerase III subunit epsilon n=1 Tax=Sphingomonas sp. IC4-52 TaxID=2887202 RepID=UPI001D11CC5F|nr:DNA polymerase III subunit epsilon [Sphingomonas sp. IC4-52]MCC2980743.1 DNA polymerase III subunit epsilon [Sphingomonas sp. IC4-52]